MIIFRPLMASYLPYPNYLTKHYYIIYISIKFKVNLKHRTHPKFPKYRIYADGTIINKRTGHTLRRKYALKIMNESNQRVPVITPELIAEAFRIPNPNPYKYIRYKNGNLKAK